MTFSDNNKKTNSRFSNNIQLTSREKIPITNPSKKKTANMSGPVAKLHTSSNVVTTSYRFLKPSSIDNTKNLEKMLSKNKSGILDTSKTKIGENKKLIDLYLKDLSINRLRNIQTDNLVTSGERIKSNSQDMNKNLNSKKNSPLDNLLSQRYPASSKNFPSASYYLKKVNLNHTPIKKKSVDQTDSKEKSHTETEHLTLSEINILDEKYFKEEKKKITHKSNKNISPTSMLKLFKETERVKTLTGNTKNNSNKKDKFKNLAKTKDLKKSPTNENKLSNRVAQIKNKFNSEMEGFNTDDSRHKKKLNTSNSFLNNKSNRKNQAHSLIKSELLQRKSAEITSNKNESTKEIFFDDTKVDFTYNRNYHLVTSSFDNNKEYICIKDNVDGIEESDQNDLTRIVHESEQLDENEIYYDLNDKIKRYQENEEKLAKKINEYDLTIADLNNTVQQKNNYIIELETKSRNSDVKQQIIDNNIKSPKVNNNGNISQYQKWEYITKCKHLDELNNELQQKVLDFESKIFNLNTLNKESIRKNNFLTLDYNNQLQKVDDNEQKLEEMIKSNLDLNNESLVLKEEHKKLNKTYEETLLEIKQLKMETDIIIEKEKTKNDLCQSSTFVDLDISKKNLALEKVENIKLKGDLHKEMMSTNNSSRNYEKEINTLKETVNNLKSQLKSKDDQIINLFENNPLERIPNPFENKKIQQTFTTAQSKFNEEATEDYSKLLENYTEIKQSNVNFQDEIERTNKLYNEQLDLNTKISTSYSEKTYNLKKLKENYQLITENKDNLLIKLELEEKNSEDLRVLLEKNTLLNNDSNRQVDVLNKELHGVKEEYSEKTKLYEKYQTLYENQNETLKLKKRKIKDLKKKLESQNTSNNDSFYQNNLQQKLQALNHEILQVKNNEKLTLYKHETSERNQEKLELENKEFKDEICKLKSEIQTEKNTKKSQETDNISNIFETKLLKRQLSETEKNLSQMKQNYSENEKLLSTLSSSQKHEKRIVSDKIEKQEIEKKNYLSEIAMLSQENYQISNDISNYKSNNEILSEELQISKDQIFEFKDFLTKYENKLEFYEELNEKVTDENLVLKDMNEKLEQKEENEFECNEFSIINKNMVDKSKQSNEIINDLQNKVKKQNRVIEETTKNSLIDNNRFSQEIINLNQQIDDFNSQLETSKSNLIKERKEFQINASKICELENEFVNLKYTKENLELENLQQQSKISGFDKEVYYQNKQEEELNDADHDTVQTLDVKVNEMQDCLKDLQEKFKTEVQKNLELEEHLDNLKHELVMTKYHQMRKSDLRTNRRSCGEIIQSSIENNSVKIDDFEMDYEDNESNIKTTDRNNLERENLELIKELKIAKGEMKDQDELIKYNGIKFEEYDSKMEELFTKIKFKDSEIEFLQIQTEEYQDKAKYQENCVWNQKNEYEKLLIKPDIDVSLVNSDSLYYIEGKDNQLEQNESSKFKKNQVDENSIDLDKKYFTSQQSQDNIAEKNTEAVKIESPQNVKFRQRTISLINDLFGNTNNAANKRVTLNNSDTKDKNSTKKPNNLCVDTDQKDPNVNYKASFSTRNASNKEANMNNSFNIE